MSDFILLAANSKTDECIIFPYGKDKCGYGRLARKHGDVLAHRAVCITVHGLPNAGKPNALHSCGNRSCVNPRHLRWGDQSENRNDMRKDGTLPKAESNGASRLSWDKVKVMREMNASGATQRALAAHFGVGIATVCNVVNNKSWVI